MHDLPGFDLPDDLRAAHRPAAHWLEWAIVIVLGAAFVVGVASFIAILKGWI